MRWVRTKEIRFLTLALCSFASLPSMMTGSCLDLLSCSRQLQEDSGEIVGGDACQCPMCRSGAAGESCACCRHDGKCSCSMSSADDENGQTFSRDAAVLRKQEPFSDLPPFVRRVGAVPCLISITELTVPAPPPKAKTVA